MHVLNKILKFLKLDFILSRGIERRELSVRAMDSVCDCLAVGRT